MIRSKKLCLIAPMVLASGLHAGNVVADWNAIGSTTVVANGGKTPGASTIWFAYSSLAMYDAVNAITGDYEPFYYRIAGPSNASIDAAAVAAAHRILVNYFPAQQTALDTQFTASLAAVMGDPDAKTAGVAVGEAASMALYQRPHRRRSRSQRNLHARIGSWGLDPDTSRLRRSRDSVARSDAAVHDEIGERPAPGSSQSLEQRALEPGLQPDSKLRRSEQHRSIRSGNRDRSLLDGAHRTTICPGIQQPGYQQQSGHCGCGPSDGDGLDRRCGRGNRVFQREVQVRFLEAGHRDSGRWRKRRYGLRPRLGRPGDDS